MTNLMEFLLQQQSQHSRAAGGGRERPVEQDGCWLVGWGNSPCMHCIFTDCSAFFASFFTAWAVISLPALFSPVWRVGSEVT